jgi:CBS domain-containing protein
MRTAEISLREEIDSILGTVDTIMQRKVIVLRPGEPLQDAIRQLERAGVSGGPVMEGERVVGMVSLADMFRSAGVDPNLAATSGPWHRYEHFVANSHLTVADAMSKRLVTISLGATIAEAAEAMRSNAVNRVPVLDDEGSLIGIVARDDIIAAVAAASRAVRPRRRGQ